MPTMTPLIDDRLLRLDGDGQPVLQGARDRLSGRLVFPPPAEDERYALEALPRRGNLWSWTVQRFRPKSPPYAGPEAFAPYAVGYVALDEAIIVEARLTGIDFADLRIGMALELTTLALDRADGGMVVTYAFAPADAAA